MKDSFWGLIWQSFLEIYAVPATFLGIIVSILAWIISSKTQVSLALVITIAVFTLIILITLFYAAYKAFRYNQKMKAELEQLKKTNKTLINEVNQWKTPKILRVQKDQQTGLIRCLLENSNLFIIGITISFYYIDEDEYERFIGGGFVQNIQSDGKIQAVIDQPYEVYQEVLEKLANNDRKVLERTKVTIGILKEFNQPLAE